MEPEAYDILEDAGGNKHRIPRPNPHAGYTLPPVGVPMVKVNEALFRQVREREDAIQEAIDAENEEKVFAGGARHRLPKFDHMREIHLKDDFAAAGK